MILLGDSPLDLSALHTYDELIRLLNDHAALAAARDAFLARQPPPPPSGATASVCVVFQGERATIFDSQFDWIASDEATTCHILLLRSASRRVTSLSHLDGRGDVDVGSIVCMVRDLFRPRLADVECDALADAELSDSFVASVADETIDVMIVGGYCDERSLSEEISVTVLRALHELPFRFRVGLYCCSDGNSRRVPAAEHPYRFPGAGDADVICLPRAVALSFCPATGVACPFVPDLPTGSVVPLATLRRAAIFAGARAQGRTEHALQIFDRFRGLFCIPPLAFKPRQRAHAPPSDHFIRFNMSTSPLAEAPTFEAHVRESLAYLAANPDWRTAFPGLRSRLFTTTGVEIASE
jgi:protein N-terminal asparagine amidohydrolase